MVREYWFDVDIQKRDIHGNIEERLQKAKHEGIATQEDNILTGIDEEHIDISSGVARFKVNPALFPLNYNLQKHFEPKYFCKLLSTFTHAYTGKSIDRPEFVLIQKRSKKTHQGDLQIQPAAAGFVLYNEEPHDCALRELIEETNIPDKYWMVSDNNNKPVLTNNPKCFDITIHYLGKEKLENLVLSYVVFVPLDSTNKFPVVENLAEIDSLDEQLNPEVKAIVKVPFASVEKFWLDVLKKGRVFGPSYRTSKNFIKYFKQVLNC